MNTADQGLLAIYCDGAVLINPGGAGGWGFVAQEGARVVHRAHGPLHGASNNIAEYAAISHALAWLLEHGAKYDAAMIYSDSQLAINQITGAWGCRAPHLAALRDECVRRCAMSAVCITFEWVPREYNQEADLEAGRGVAEALGVSEEEARIVLDAAGRRLAALKANKKSKKLLFNKGLVTNYLAHEGGRKVLYLGLPPKRTKPKKEKKWL